MTVCGSNRLRETRSKSTVLIISLDRNRCKAFLQIRASQHLIVIFINAFDNIANGKVILQNVFSVIMFLYFSIGIFVVNIIYNVNIISPFLLQKRYRALRKSKIYLYLLFCFPITFPIIHE